MGKRFKRPCQRQGCNVLANGRYCEQHARLLDVNRASSHQRGYDNNWRKYRISFLVSNPLCVICEKEGRLRLASVVDHIVPHKGSRQLFWDKNNHQSLCVVCHNRKTAKDDKGYWNTHAGLR